MAAKKLNFYGEKRVKISYFRWVLEQYPKTQIPDSITLVIGSRIYEFVVEFSNNFHKLFILLDVPIVNTFSCWIFSYFQWGLEQYPKTQLPDSLT